MNKKIIFIVLISFFTVITSSARAKIPVCFPCEAIVTVQELPNDYENPEFIGEKVNLSYLNKEYGAAWIPVWNTDGRFVLSDASNKTYIEIDEELAAMLKEKYSIDIKTIENPLSFWKRIGGKIVLGLLIILIIFGSIPSKKKDVKAINI